MAYPVKTIIAALKKTHGMIYLAAEEVGCDPSTIYKMMDRIPKVKAAHDNEGEKLLDVAEIKLAESVMARESWGVKYLLSCKGKARGYGSETDPSLNVHIEVTASPMQRLTDKLEAMNERRLNGAGTVIKGRATSDS